MKTLTIEIPENKSLKEVVTLLKDNGIEIVVDRVDKPNEIHKLPNARLRKSINDALNGNIIIAKDLINKALE